MERRLTDRTAAILPVDYAGVAPDMDALLAIARRRGLKVVEDAAQGLGARYRGAPLGALGDAGCLSFHDTKNVTCGEGGALVLADRELAHRAEIVREKGTNRSAFFRGEVDKYTWVAEGSSYILSDVLAAILEVQLEKFDEIQARRAAVEAAYRGGLADWAGTHGVRLSADVPDRVGNHHIFYLLFPEEGPRDAALAHLKSRGIQATFHYVPLHSSPHGRRIDPDPRRAPRDGPGSGDAPAPAPPPAAERGRRGESDRRGPGVQGLRVAPSPHVSVVLACYNEEETLRESFAEIRDTLLEMQRSFEILFVDDVSRDRTREIIRRARGRPPRARPEGDPAREKPGTGGHGDRRLPGRPGRVAGYLDVDLEVHSRYIPSLVRAIDRGADVAVLRRIYAFQIRSLDRYVMSRGYSFLVRRMLGWRSRDTETGYKFFRRETLLPVLDAIEDPRLVLGHGVHGAGGAARPPHRGDPGRLHPPFDKRSTVRGLRDSVDYFGRLVRFRRALRSGRA